MVSAWQRIGSLRDPAALRPWLLRIATRHALARRRHDAKTEALRDDVLPTGAAAADLEHLALADALDRLPPRMRACLSLHYYAGLSVAETATALGISPNTAKYHLKTGLARIREALQDEPMQMRHPRAEA